jgi:hypothetical protein
MPARTPNEIADAFSSREPVPTSLENAILFVAFSSREPVPTALENAILF